MPNLSVLQVKQRMCVRVVDGRAAGPSSCFHCGGSVTGMECCLCEIRVCLDQCLACDCAMPRHINKLT
jgi:hypothetical protein